MKCGRFLFLSRIFFRWVWIGWRCFTACSANGCSDCMLFQTSRFMSYWAFNDYLKSSVFVGIHVELLPLSLFYRPNYLRRNFVIQVGLVCQVSVPPLPKNMTIGSSDQFDWWCHEIVAYCVEGWSLFRHACWSHCDVCRGGITSCWGRCWCIWQHVSFINFSLVHTLFSF